MRHVKFVWQWVTKMRKLFFVSLLFATNVHAVDVMSSACGNSFEEALTSAKMSALDKVNGAWLHGDSYVRDNLFKEKITQYNGGVIKSYEILKQDSMCVIIKADVVPRSNKVQRNDTTIPQSLKNHLDGAVDEQKRLEQAVKVIDDRRRALAFTPAKIELTPQSDGKVKIIIEGSVTLQEKWVADYLELTKMAGKLSLQSFYKQLRVSVDGYDSGKIVSNSTFSFYDDLNVYSATTNGVVIRPKQVDMVKFQFFIDQATLKKLDKLEVNFI